MSGANSGEAAVDILCEERFDMVVVDYKMPGVTGFEVFTQAARVLHPDLAAVLVTGHGASALMSEANPPFTSDELRSTVEQVLGGLAQETR
ncbi:MAG TPA: response regulator [Methylomirabilota bacterium]|nr:response regulator [Methylomirabilota bacterium]